MEGGGRRDGAEGRWGEGAFVKTVGMPVVKSRTEIKV